jgi:GNAT superfamily N-acetyltransferase
MALDIVPLRDQHLQDAALLVQSRYRALKQPLPLLPARWERLSEIAPLLREMLPTSPGVAAIRDGKLVGFMMALIIPSFLGQRTAYCPEWANGATYVEPGVIYEQMYGRLAVQWASSGCRLHAVSLMALDAVTTNAWHWMGFGLVTIDALRDLSPVDVKPSSVKIRMANMGDVGTATTFGELLQKHLTSPPISWQNEPHDYAQWLRAPGNVMWLAQAGGKIVGCMGLSTGNPDASLILRDDKTASIVMTFVTDRYRGQGVAGALLNHALEAARNQGYERCAVDFEPMNTAAARFWLKWFKPATYTMLRWIPDKL